MFDILQQKPNDILSIGDLLDESFGKDRLEKTAYRLRDNINPVAELCFVLRDGGQLLASLQFWPVLIKQAQGAELEALLLGPIAVQEKLQGQGHGIRLMQHALEKARKLGHKRVILVGDEAYYKRVGFSRALAQGLTMPGPVDQNRLLGHELVPGALKNIKGRISRITRSAE